MQDNNELLHYGVPGMRWGHRTNRKYTTANTVAKKRAAADKAKSNLSSTYKKGTAEDYMNAKKAYKKANKDYQRESKKTNVLNEKPASKIEKRMFGDKKSRKLVNKYLNRGESVKSAKTKAYAVQGAKRVATALAVIGAAALIKAQKKPKNTI